MERLKAVHALKCTPYSSANAEHENLLARLWACGFPGVPMRERVSQDWLHLGFQGSDPATDFRGQALTLALTLSPSRDPHIPSPFHPRQTHAHTLVLHPPLALTPTHTPTTLTLSP